MLREREVTQRNPAVGEAGARDVVAGDDEDAGGFVMPCSEPGSDAEEEVARNTPALPSRVSVPTAQPRGVVAGSRSSQADGERETAAEYVERVQRGFAAQRDCTVDGTIDQATDSLTATDSPAKAASAAIRSRSSEPMSGSGGGVVQAKLEEGSSARARSNDHRVAVANARSSPPWPGDSDDSDDDGVCSAAAKGLQWKADVKSIVRDFAHKNRTNGMGVVPGPDDRTAAPRRPPKAPSNDALVPARNPVSGTVSEEPKRRPSLKEEVKPGEELIYSRRPRNVDYVPATLETYKQKYAGIQSKHVSLGPDLDDDNLLIKKANKEKVKEFSKELSMVNKGNHRRALQSEPKPEPKPEPKSTARSKALEFAKNSVPKPKPAPKPTLLVEPQCAIAPSAIAPRSSGDAEREKLRALEERHFQDRERAERIQEYVSQIAC
jgi:hypothetical protein